MTTNRPGRPQAPAGTRRSASVRVPLTEREKLQLLEASQALRMPLAEFLRSAALQRAATPAACSTTATGSDSSPVCSPWP